MEVYSRDAALARLARRLPPLALSSRPMPVLNEAAVVFLSALSLTSFFWGPLWLGRSFSKGDWRTKGLLLVVMWFLTSGPAARLEKIRHWGIWRLFLQYFSVRLVDETLPSEFAAFQRPQDSQKTRIPPRSVLALEPHGVVPWGIAASLIGPVATHLGGVVRPIAASISFRLPLLRHLLLAVGGAPATRQAVARVMQDPQPGHVAITPGGIAGMFAPAGYETGPIAPSPLGGREEARLRHRYGYVRLALEAGRPIVPIFVFGASRVLALASVSRWLEKISRDLKTSLLIMTGRFGLPIPFRVPLFFAVGKPVYPTPTPPNQPIPRWVVEDVTRRVAEQMRQLYLTYREVYGWGERPIDVI